MAKIIFGFAGQGSQYVGMGKDLYENSEAAKNIFDKAEEIMPGVKDTCFNADIETLSKTENTQPCLFLVDLAAAYALEEKGIKADLVAGFSLGEIPALAYTGVLSFEDAFKLVMKRAELMSIATKENEGGMAAVLKLSFEQVEKLCENFDKVYPVNYNCPGQLVVAGDKEQLKAFAELAAEQKGRVKMLNVSGAFHTPFMKSAGDGLKTMLDSMTVNAPKTTLYSNYTAMPYGDDAVSLIVNQVQSPVKWMQTIENMEADVFVEVGAGKTLSGLVKKINSELKVLNVQDKSSLETTVNEIGG